MHDPLPAQQELIAEIAALKKRIQELELAEAEHRLSEETLRRSEIKFRTLYDSTSDAIVLLDETGYCDCNQAALAMFGFAARADFCAQHPADLSPPLQPCGTDSLALSKRYIAAAFAGGRLQFEWLHKRADNGREFPVDVSLTALVLDGKPVLQAVIRDITRRRQAEEALRQSEEKYRQITENMSDIVTEEDAQGVIKYTSPSHKLILGDASADLTGKSGFDRVHPDDREMVAASFREALRTKTTSREEYRYRHADGHYIWLQSTGHPVINSAGEMQGMVINSIVITERKLAEFEKEAALEALKKEEEKYRTLLNNIRDGVFIMQDSRFQFVNEAFCRITGYSAAEIAGVAISDIIAPADLEAVESNYKRRLAGEDVVRDYEFRIIPRDKKTTVHVNISAELVEYRGQNAVMGMIQDITARKRAEEHSRQSEEKFRQVFMMSPDCIAISRLADGLVIDANNGFEKITGWRRKDVIRQRTSADLNFWQATAERDFMVRELNSGRDVLHREFQFRRNDGTIRTGIYSARSIAIAGENCLIFSMQDITERKQLEERLNRAQKMEALGQLAGGVAHDLNNVLGILSGYSELLLLEIPAGQRARTHVEKILQSTLKGDAIIKDLLTMARRGVTVTEVVSLNSIVAVFLQSPVFEKLKDFHPRIIFRTELSDRLLNIKGSPVHLEKTLMNLVANAAEAIAGAGEVTIRTENRYLDRPAVGSEEAREGDYTVLTVSDTGAGIPAEHLGNIFEPFYTKKTMGRSGTGLGLAIVWGTVKDHNGYIDVQTEVGRGTVFTLYFPVTREEPAGLPPDNTVRQYRGSGEKVLVVDDIAEQREVACVMLTELGYAVHAVASGEAAVEFLRENDADILVLDMIMPPGMDGLATYKSILQIKPRQKAILVSGFSETARVRKAQKLGAGAYVKKPYMLETIGLAIREELRR